MALQDVVKTKKFWALVLTAAAAVLAGSTDAGQAIFAVLRALLPA